VHIWAWETLWKPGAPGVGPGLGYAHVHTGPARELEQYYSERGLSHLLPAAETSVELWTTLLSFEGNTRYVAAEVRRLAEIRQQAPTEYGQLATLDPLTVTDVTLIMDGYWVGVGSRYTDKDYSPAEFSGADGPATDRGPLVTCSYGYYSSYFQGG
jgi:hypothetical protein